MGLRNAFGKAWGREAALPEGEGRSVHWKGVKRRLFRRKGARLHGSQSSWLPFATLPGTSLRLDLRLRSVVRV